jgi:hypothetical protein
LEIFYTYVPCLFSYGLGGGVSGSKSVRISTNNFTLPSGRLPSLCPFRNMQEGRQRQEVEILRDIFKTYFDFDCTTFALDHYHDNG